MDADLEPPAAPWLLRNPVGLLVLAIAAMWGVEGADSWLLDDRLQAHGIQPRRRSGLDGVLWAPWLHGGVGHLASNTVPFLVLGGLVAVRGLRYWVWVTATAVLLGGGLTWAFAGVGNHVGASGVVFGYLGAILGAAIFERRPAALGAALLAIFLYSGMLAGLVPQDDVSWEGHLFGMFGGFLAARVMAEPRRPSVDDPDDVQPWELDEPWLD